MDGVRAEAPVYTGTRGATHGARRTLTRALQCLPLSLSASARPLSANTGSLRFRSVPARGRGGEPHAGTPGALSAGRSRLPVSCRQGRRDPPGAASSEPSLISSGASPPPALRGGSVSGSHPGRAEPAEPAWGLARLGQAVIYVHGAALPGARRLSEVKQDSIQPPP